MHKTMFLKLFMLLVVAVTGWVYGGWHGLFAWESVYGYGQRPYLYRVLIPDLTWLLVLAGVSLDRALQVVMMLSVVGLFYALNYLLTAFRRKQL